MSWSLGIEEADICATAARRPRDQTAVPPWDLRAALIETSFEIHTAPGQAVVDSGLYRFIRHPSHAGALIFALGLTVTHTNWLAPLMVLVLTYGYVRRNPAEERR